MLIILLGECVDHFVRWGSVDHFVRWGSVDHFVRC